MVACLCGKPFRRARLDHQFRGGQLAKAFAAIGGKIPRPSPIVAPTTPPTPSPRHPRLAARAAVPNAANLAHDAAAFRAKRKPSHSPAGTPTLKHKTEQFVDWESSVHNGARRDIARPATTCNPPASKPRRTESAPLRLCQRINVASPRSAKPMHRQVSFALVSSAHAIVVGTTSHAARTAKRKRPSSYARAAPCLSCSRLTIDLAPKASQSIQRSLFSLP
jgi:hypothetical protein